MIDGQRSKRLGGGWGAAEEQSLAGRREGRQSNAPKLGERGQQSIVQSSQGVNALVIEGSRSSCHVFPIIWRGFARQPTQIVRKADTTFSGTSRLRAKKDRRWKKPCPKRASNVLWV